MENRFSDDQKRELRRLVSNLRSLVASSVALTAPLDALKELADAAEALEAKAAAFAGQRPFERFGPPIDGDLNTILPWSVISGRYHPLAVPVAMRVADGKVIGTVTFGLAYEGPPDGVHGAMVAAVYDEVLAFAGMINGTPGHTGTLTIKYRGITPLHTELRFEAWVERTDGRKITVHGSCYAGDTLCTEAEALFIQFQGGFAG